MTGAPRAEPKEPLGGEPVGGLARERFPRGLEQPQGAYRSGADALWLADFVAFPPDTAKGGVFVDLGTGCGMAAFALLLRYEGEDAGGRRGAAPRGAGIEIDGELAEAARRNALSLGLDRRMRVFVGDVGDQGLVQGVRAAHGACDLALANPPWRLLGQGREPPSPRRGRALFGTPETLPAFAASACLLLRPGGRFAWVVGAARLADAIAALASAGLTPRRLRCIHAHAGAPAMLALIESVKKGQGGRRVATPPPLHVEAPLFVR